MARAEIEELLEAIAIFRGVINEILRMIEKVDDSKSDDEISKMLRKLEEIRGKKIRRCNLKLNFKKNK